MEKRAVRLISFGAMVRTPFFLFLLAAVGASQNPLTPGLKPFISYDDPVIALEHIRVIDGTGAPAREDQTIVIDHGRIGALGAAAAVAIPAGARRISLANATVIPGLVGMHEHLFYWSPPGLPIIGEQLYSFPRMYLAAGVTTARTAGSVEPYTDLNLKKWIDEGRMPGPKLHVTIGYLEGKGMFTPQMAEIDTPEQARAFVDYWASQGADSFKAYMNIERAPLAAAIQAAHAHGLKLTGHLCSVGFREAAAMGIDNLEHGIIAPDGELIPGKQPDVCPPDQSAILKVDVNGEAVQQTIRELVGHHVAVTSTLAVLEANVPIQPRFQDALSPSTALAYFARRSQFTQVGFQHSADELRVEVAFERAFAKAGGLLMAGADPTGSGGALAGFADQRNIELLVQGGFTPLEAIRIATLNGAEFMGIADRIGSIAVGKQADLVVIDGDPGTKIADIEKVTTVFKDGVGFDSAKLLQSVRGHVGQN
jgi:imidazolonepropionase-like amidohydrolase